MARNQRLYMQQLIPHQQLSAQLNRWGREGWALVSLTPPGHYPAPYTTLQGSHWFAVFETETFSLEETERLSDELRGLEAAGVIHSGMVDQR